jgi:hypothetical protein
MHSQPPKHCEISLSHNGKYQDFDILRCGIIVWYNFDSVTLDRAITLLKTMQT